MDPKATPSQCQVKPTSENAALIAAAQDAVSAPSRIASITDPNGNTLILTLGNLSLNREAMSALEYMAPRPRRAKGSSSHLDQASFIEHINRHKVASSVVFADPNKLSLLAIYDYNDPSLSKVAVLDTTELKTATPGEPLPMIGEANEKVVGKEVGQPGAPFYRYRAMSMKPCHTQPNWGEHRSSYACPKSPEWVIWSKASNQFLTGEAFAELIEDNTKDIVADKDEQGNEMPTAAQLLKMALELKIDTRKVVGRKYNPVTGECSLNYTEDHQEGSTKIPAAFMIAIPVFMNSSSRIKLTCKVRMKMEGSIPKFGFLIPDLERAAAMAFQEVIGAVKKETALPVFVGTPE